MITVIEIEISVVLGIACVVLLSAVVLLSFQIISYLKQEK